MLKRMHIDHQNSQSDQWNHFHPSAASRLASDAVDPGAVQRTNYEHSQCARETHIIT